MREHVFLCPHQHSKAVEVSTSLTPWVPSSLLGFHLQGSTPLSKKTGFRCPKTGLPSLSPNPAHYERKKKRAKAKPRFNYASRKLHTSPPLVILWLEFGFIVIPTCREEWVTKCLLQASRTQLKIRAPVMEDKRENVRLSRDLGMITGLWRSAQCGYEMQVLEMLLVSGGEPEVWFVF